MDILVVKVSSLFVKGKQGYFVIWKTGGGGGGGGGEEFQK